jgi:hypothetical protein
MGEATVTFWPDLQAFMQHPGVVLRHWPLHERSQREHADAAGNGEERDDGGECVHEGRGIESTLQQEPDPASIVKHYYKAGRQKKKSAEALSVPNIHGSDHILL